MEGRIDTQLGRAVPAALPLLRHSGKSRNSRLLYRASKRLLDLVLASVLLVLTLPVLLVAMAAVLLTTGKSPLLAQRRAGLRGRPFRMLKLRTMRDAPVFDAGLAAKSPADPRITAVGAFLRRSSIDELPQLLNVLLGQMSLVGPRPLLLSEAELLRPGWQRRLDVPPGLTGLWQVSGRSSISVERWMALDRLYLRRRSLLLDLAILQRTMKAVVTMRGAW